ncbi:hypothetical protein DFR69_10569 [Nocardia neocaledoniensis]|uniref:Uncharacterized protein n=1 Tax=Nocardia neocaledoniensis TaxID=236511 RepID=A0A317NJJ8_9NOCA|nr:hypothetical protein DFR69_10569 [Nocardia neocaledoniensis]
MALLDKAHFPSDVPSTSAFQSNWVEVLARIGVLDDVMAAGAAVLRRAVITATSGAFTGEIDPEVYGTVWGMHRTSIDRILVAAARAAGAEVRTGCGIRAMTPGPRPSVGEAQGHHASEARRFRRSVCGAGQFETVDDTGIDQVGERRRGGHHLLLREDSHPAVARAGVDPHRVPRA